MPESKYQKLGGWLLFVVVTQIIIIGYSLFVMLPTWFQTLRSLQAVARTWTRPGLSDTSWPLRFGLCLLAVICDLTLRSVFVIMILKRTPNFLKYFELLAILNFVLAPICLMVLGSTLGQISFLPNSSSESRLISSYVSIMIWLWYFCDSLRVRVYMGGNAYLRKSIFFRRAFKRATKNPSGG